MIKRVLLTIFALLLMIGALAGLKAMQIKTLIAAGETMRPPPLTVASAIAETAQWENTFTAIGTLEAGQGVMITAEAPGRVTELLFNGGEFVSAGQVLVSQDVKSEQSQLSMAESSLNLAQSNFERISRLYENKVLSQAEFDAAKSQLSTAEAEVTGYNTAIAKKQIIAPFDGRLGLSLVDLGQDLSAGIPIVSLQSVDEMLVNFSLPQRALAQVSTDLAVRITVDALPNQKLSGKITAINTQIDNETRNVTVQATLDATDTDASLLPGMYSSIEVVLPESDDVLMIPTTAVNFATYGDSVFIIESSKNENAQSESMTVRQQFVQLGERRGDFVSVIKGLEQGQMVVSEGVFKVRNGAAVVLQEAGKINPSLEPNPDNT